jgi:hypothetical protein
LQACASRGLAFTALADRRAASGMRERMGEALRRDAAAVAEHFSTSFAA